MSTVTTYKISEALCEEDFLFFALYSSVDDHVLAYSLNHHLNLKLMRSRVDLDLAEGVSFPLFEWNDQLNDRCWTLLTNHCNQEENLEREDLFQNEISTTVRHLLPEFREVDFFLKIAEDYETTDRNLLKNLLNIPQIITAHNIDMHLIKSRQNLIF